MKIRATSSFIDKIETDIVVLSFFEDERPLKGSTGLADWRTCGMLSKFILENRVTGEFKEKLLLPVKKRLACSKLLVVGLGPAKLFTFERYAQIIDIIMITVVKLDAVSFAMPLPGVGMAGLDYGLATTRFCESLISIFRPKRELLADLSVLIVAQGPRLKEINPIIAKHERRMNEELAT